MLRLPCPPQFKHSSIRVPKYFPYEHPYTKWILNTFRSGADNRLKSMLRERPQLFAHVFQIIDCPDKIMWDQCDLEHMFKRSSVLYLRPLSLAVYMKRRTIIQLLIQSGLVNSTEISYATDTCIQSELCKSSDIIEFNPDIVAVRRNFFEALPLIYTNDSQSKHYLTVMDPISMRYAKKGIERIMHYQDIFAYAIEVVKKNRILNLSRLFDILVFHCHGFCAANVNHMFCPTHAGQNYSLFRRLLQPLVFGDPGGRLTFHLIHSMELLIKLNLFYNPKFDSPSEFCEGKPPMNTCLKYAINLWPRLSCHTQDCLVSLALLMKLYDMILSRTSGGSLPLLGELVSHVIDVLDCREYMENASTVELTKSIEFLLRSEHDPFGQLEKCHSATCEENDYKEDTSCRYMMLSPPPWSTLDHIQQSVKTVADAERMGLISRQNSQPEMNFTSGVRYSQMLHYDSANNQCPFCSDMLAINNDNEAHNSTPVPPADNCEIGRDFRGLSNSPPVAQALENDSDLTESMSISLYDTDYSSKISLQNGDNRRLSAVARLKAVIANPGIENLFEQGGDISIQQCKHPNMAKPNTQTKTPYTKCKQVSISDSKRQVNLILKKKFTLKDVDLLIEKMMNTNNIEHEKDTCIFYSDRVNS